MAQPRTTRHFRSVTTSIPNELRTPRLLLRPWRATDAAELLPILDANRAHLGPWIPARVAEPVALPLLEERLRDFGDKFAAEREWRFALLSVDDGRVLGEIDLFSRDAGGRVPFADADRAELGYWLRSDATGRGLVLEGARAVLAAAAATTRFGHIEIRCDPRNAPSVGVAERLGFTLAQTIESEPLRAGEPRDILQVWTSPLEPFAA